MSARDLEERPQNRRDDDRWKVKKEVSAGDIVAIAIAITAVVASYVRLDARVTTVEIVSNQNSSAIAQSIQELKAELRRLGDKLDRFTERTPR